MMSDNSIGAAGTGGGEEGKQMQVDFGHVHSRERKNVKRPELV